MLPLMLLLQKDLIWGVLCHNLSIEKIYVNVILYGFCTHPHLNFSEKIIDAFIADALIVYKKLKVR